MTRTSIALLGLIIALVVLAFSAPRSGAYPQYSVNRDASFCAACHGDFLAPSYTSLSDGQVWNSLHDLHRFDMLGSDCTTCHVTPGSFPVEINASGGGTGFPPIGCVGCHGREEDMGNDTISDGRGAGLRQHHHNANVTLCSGCHFDADPLNYTPVGEDVAPAYYFTPDTSHPDKPTDACSPAGEEDYAGLTDGLDNDGDLLYDGNDPDCAPPVCTATAVRSCRDHGGTECCIDVSTLTEPRLGGINKLEMDLDDASGDTSVASVICTIAGDVTANASASAAGNTVTVTFAPAIVDETCTVMLACGASACVRSVQGDINGDGTTTTGDASIIKPHFNHGIPDGGGHGDDTDCRADYNADASITTADFSQVKPEFNNTGGGACP